MRIRLKMNSLLPTNCQQVSNNLHTQHKPYFQIVSGHQNSTVLDQIARMQLSSYTESGVPPEGSFGDHSFRGNFNGQIIRNMMSNLL